MVPVHSGFLHAEGNSEAHVKSTLTGVSLCVGVEAGHLALGRWQRVFFCEFDGPRQRELWLRFIDA
jgi:secondary thiamine-phosphate synthase enzyme